MNNIEKITKLLADDYFQAAICGCDMFRITEILEEFRGLISKSEDYKKIEDRLDVYLGENLENEKEFKIILQLRRQFIQLKKEDYKKEISEVFQTDEQKGWLRWLELFGKELSKLNRDICRFLLELEVPDAFTGEFRYIKKHFPYITEERWVEGELLFEHFIGKEHIEKDVRSDLHMLAGAIQLYHLLENEKALAHFEQAKLLQSGTARTERIFGEYFIQQQNFDKARDFLQKALDLDKKDFENYVVLGNLYKAENRYEAAASWYNEGMRENPGKADLYNRLLLLNDQPAYFEKHTAEIGDLLEIIIKLDPEFEYTALNNAAYVYQKNQDFNKAEEYYDKAIQLFPGRVHAYCNLGYSYLEKNELKKSEEAFHKTIDLDSQSFDGYWGLVALYRQKKDWKAVIQNLKICEKYRPQWLHYFYNDSGNAYEKLNDIKNAQKYYLLALQHDPEKKFGLVELLNIAELNLDKETGISLLKKIHEIKGERFEGDYHYRAAIIYYNNSEFHEAVEHFEKATAIDPGNPVKLEYLGLAWEKSGDYEKAESYYREAIETANENKCKYLNRLGYFLTERGRYDESVEILNKAIELNPASLYYENLGYAFEQSGKLAEAEAIYQKAVEMAEYNKDVYENRLGIFYYNQGKYDQSITHYSRAVELNPKPVYFENLGLSYDNLSQPQKAEENYRKALESEDGPNDKYYNRLAFFLSGQGRYTEAIDLLKIAIQLRPNSVYYENLGYACENLGRYKEAEKHYRTALELSENNKDAYLNRLGIFYYNRQEYEKAVEFYKKAIELYPEAVYYENIGNAYNALGNGHSFEDALLKAAELKPSEGKYYFQLGWTIMQKYDDTKKSKQYLYKAIEIYKQTPEIEPEELMSIQYLGAAYQKEGNLDKAEEIFMEAYEIDSENDLICTLLGKLFFEKKDYDRSVKYYKKALQLSPDKYQSYMNLGDVLEQKGETDDAIKILLEGIKLEPALNESIAKIYFSAKDYENAEVYFRKAVDAYPENYLYRQYLGLAFHFQQKYKEAEDEFTTAMQLAPPQHSAIYINYIGNTWFGRKHYEKAYENYLKASNLDPDNSIYYDNVITALTSGKKYEEAKTALEEKLRMDSDNNYWVNKLGLIFFTLGDYKNAASHFKKYTILKPDDPLGYDNLGLTFEKLGETEKAVNAYMDGTRNDHGFYDKIGKVYFDQKDYASAEKFVRKALDRAPENDVYLTNLGMALANQNRLEEAAELYEKAVEIRNDNPPYLGYLAEIKAAQEKYEDAVSILGKAIQLEKVYKDKYHFQLANLYQKIDKNDKAVENYEAAIQIYPDARYYDGLGSLYQKNENFELAAEMYLQALKTHPGDTELREKFLKSCNNISDEEIRKKLFDQAQEIKGMGSMFKV
jgi:superkiller protein 3